MILLALACTGPGPSTDDSTALEQPLPEVWGLDAAQDHDPDPNVVEVHLTAAETQVDWGLEKATEVWTYNGQAPGPLIQVREGDTLRVVLENQLPDEEETTIHWHGLRVSDDMDGIPHIQEPVQVGEQFVYEFVVDDPATFWYHPHVRTYKQIEKGLQGALIVHEADAPQVPERMFVMDDVYIKDNGNFYGFNLDNNHMMQVHGRYGNMLLVNGSSEPLTDTVRPGQAERWRVVNTANARTMWVSVEGADWRIIGVDGGLLEEPYTVSKRELLPVGGRLDLEVIPHGDASEVVLNLDLPGSGAGKDSYPMFTATVEGDEGDYQWQDWPAVEVPEQLPVEQEAAMTLNGVSGSERVEWTINGEMFGDHEPITAQGGVPTWITVKDKSGAEHPFHLHGNFFEVVERNGEPTDEPGLRDTVLVNGDDTLLLYTELENAGRWMAHCHILEHAELGMMTELVVE